MFSCPCRMDAESRCGRARLAGNMTSFVIVFEILFLLLIASLSSLGQHASPLNPQDDHSTQRHHLQRPPDWRLIEANKLPKRTENKPANAQLRPRPTEKKQQNIYSLEYQNSTVEARRRTKRSPRADRYEGGLALVASSTGLSSSATTSVPSSSSSATATAELCYLASGGSSLTLTVNEATPVGSLIGTIDVNGDPSLEGGNVDLLDGLDQAASGSGGGGGGGTLSSPDSSSAAAAAGSTGGRQNRRLLGRRDTSDASEGVTPVAAALTSPFYALVGSALAPTTTTTGSPATATTAATNANQQQQQQVAAVRVQPGTKNLLLARPLDKESAEGEASLLVNVRCRARQSAAYPSPSPSPSSSPNPSQAQTSNGGKLTGIRKQSADATYTTIPIRLIVTDANDHAPEFVAPTSAATGLPYVINISETTPVGSVASRDILAIDKDSAGPHSTLHYRVLESPDDDKNDDGAPLKGAANLFAFTNPLEPTLWLTGPLDYETLPAASFMLTIVAQDQGEPEPLQTSAQVQVNVLDFDDQNPKFLDEKYTLVMDEIQASLVGQNLRVLPRNLRAEDGDRGINAPIVYSFDLSSSSSTEPADARQPLVEFNDSRAAAAADPALNIEQYLHLNPTSGELRLIRQWPSGPASLPLTLVIRATQADNRDRYALTTLTVTRAAAGSAVAGGPHQNAQGLAAAGGLRQVGVAAKTPNKGIEFVQERLTVQVPEDTPASEKIARVRAHHLAVSGQAQAGGHQVDQTSGDPPEIAEQKRRLMQLVASSSPAPSPTGGGSGANNPRPINYQILDDQTDQFGINGLGEILLKRPLDYEQRQEFRFRVLATYTRYSDICHVHVQVVNVNDNKPKFAQSQYSFHLTESRLRSNSLGQVAAHDADLNDTIQYAILAAGPASSSSPPPQEQCARLFEISPAGQLSLRTSTRALNASQCQLIVQASDSLVSQSSWHSKAHNNQQRHQQQVRVNIYVAPQLIGRSLNLNALTAGPHDQQQQQQRPGEHEPKLFSSRSLQAEQGAQGTSWRGAKFVAPGGREHAQLAAESSTIASTNFQQPAAPNSQRSSMATVVASLQHMMKSVNFFEMPMSSALLLSALLTFLVCLLLIVIISMSVHVYRRRGKSSSRVRHLTAAARMRHAHLVAAAAAAAAAASSSAGTGSSNAGSSPGYGSSSSSSSSPATTHSIASPGPAAHHYQQQRPAGGGVANRKSPVRAAEQPPAANRRNLHNADEAAVAHKDVGVSSGTNQNHTGDPAPSKSDRDPKKWRPPPPQQQQNKLEHLGQLKISISSADEQIEHDNHLFGANNRTAPTTKLNPLYLETPRAPVSSQVKSPLGSGRSAVSSTLTDDSTASSLAHCGHYSVNGTMELNPRGPPPKHATKLERALNDLVRPHDGAGENVGNKLRPNPTTTGVAEQGELEQLTRGKPGVRAYRPLPMMNSLVRPVRKPQQVVGAGGRGNKVAPFEQLLSSHQQRIEQQEAAEQRHQQLRATTSAVGLMALVRDSVQLGGAGSADGPASSGGGGESPQIRWPSESIPHKIKKLTWDDEMSCCDNESMLEMDFNNNNGNNNSMQEQQPPPAEQSKFLFSLNSHTQLPSLNQQQQYAAPSMDADPNLTLNLESHHQQQHNYQNNCLDYTIVESSQFHVDSLASVDMRSLMSPRCYVQDKIGLDAHSPVVDNQRPQSQDATTFKLNQNYQDLKLMTTAVL